MVGNDGGQRGWAMRVGNEGGQQRWAMRVGDKAGLDLSTALGAKGLDDYGCEATTSPFSMPTGLAILMDLQECGCRWR